MAKKPTLQSTNFSAGECSDLFEARPDVGKRFNAVRVMENFWPYPEGGAYRRPGTKYLCEVKDSNKSTLLIPFEFSSEDAFIIEVGEGYFRFIKNRVQLATGGLEAIVNGSLDTNLTGWIDASIGGGVIEWSNGAMKLAANGSLPTRYAAARQALATTIGVQYTVMFDIVTGLDATGDAVLAMIGASVGGSELAIRSFSALGTHTFTFIAIGTSTHIEFRAASSVTVPIKYIDNISLLGSPSPTIYEVTGSPYLEGDLHNIHYRQSADVLFTADGAHEIQKLTRLTDTNWSRSNFNADPPPSFAADENLNVIGYPSANTGTIQWRVATDLFLAGDEDRRIAAGTGIGNITVVDGSGKEVTVDVTSDFSATFAASVPTLSSSGTTVTSAGHGRSAGQAIILTSGAQAGEIRIITAILTSNTYTIDAGFSVGQSAGKTYNWTAGIAAGLWFLRGAPQATMDSNKKEPIGALANITMSIASMRASYVGMFIKALGGVIEITEFVTPTNVKGIIRSILTESTTANPAAVAIGAWRLDEASWSSTRGHPKTLEFHQGRLVPAATNTQPTTVWGSNLYDINNFATGALATDAYEFTIMARSQDGIQSLISMGGLFIATANDEHVARGQGADTPIGGDEQPMVKTISTVGSQHVQPISVDNAILMLQRLNTQVNVLSYSVSESADADSLVPSDLTIFARQIGEMIFAHHRPAHYQIPNTIVFFPLSNGQLAGLTFKPRQEVAAWARTKIARTIGALSDIESVAIVPHENGQQMTVYVIVKRVINGMTKRLIEYFEDNDSTISARGWSSLQTDCAITGSILAGTTTIAVPHLEGETVHAVIGGSAVAQKTVTGGIITLAAGEIPEEDTFYEVGLHYDSTLTTLRPTIANEVTDCLKRMWKIAFIRLKNTIGGTINGKPLKQQGGVDLTSRLFTGLARMENIETEDQYDGALTLVQDQPYPMTILNIAGQVAFADEAT